MDDHMSQRLQLTRERQRVFGELVPLGGGDSVPLLKEQLLVGRRESCDIVLRFANVSAHHCQLDVDSGYWYVRDRNSRNGTKVNGVRVKEKRLEPGDVLSIAKHQYEIRYSPLELGAVGPPPSDDNPGELIRRPLLDRAGLTRASRSGKDTEALKRYDVNNDGPGQIKDPYEPL